MKRVKIGIMSLQNFQAYTKDVVSGNHKRKEESQRSGLAQWLRLPRFYPTKIVTCSH